MDRSDRIPVPHTISVDVELTPRGPDNSNHYHSQVLGPDQCYGSPQLYEPHHPDSATDSAIDLPRGDSSVSTLSDSAACCQLSPQYGKQGSHIAPSLQTITASINSSNNTLSETLDANSRVGGERHSATRPKSASYYNGTAGYMNPERHRNSSVESLNDFNMKSSGDSLNLPKPDYVYLQSRGNRIPNPDSSYEQQASPCSLETDLLVPKSLDGKLECMYSSRPDPGPMRTFRPIQNS